jgi:hypothetical protein
MAWGAGTACCAGCCAVTGGVTKSRRLGFAIACNGLVEAVVAVLTLGLATTGFVEGREISCLPDAVTWSSDFSVRVGAEASAEAGVGAGD